MSMPENYVGKSADTDYEYYRSAIQFLLPDLTGKIVTRATLRIKVKSITSSYSGLVPFLTVYGSTVDAWGTSFPQQDTDQPLVTKTGTDLAVGWLEFDVTDFVKLQTDGIASFALRANETFGGPVDLLEILYNSDDAGVDEPQLVLETQDAPPPVTPSQAPGAITTTIAEDGAATDLVIAKNPADPTVVTYFKITGITGGKLYYHNSTTEITNDTFITADEGAAGLKFVPVQDANSSEGSFSFKMQAAQDSNGTGLSPAADAVITVTEVNDKPVPSDDTLSSMDENSGPRTIPFTQLTANDSVGAVNEADEQTLEVVSVDADPSVGTVTTSGNNVIFTPAHNYHGPASFTYKVKDNGTTNGSPDAKISDNAATVSFNIDARANKPNVSSTVTTAEDTMTSSIVISANNSGGAATTNFYKISNITGGTLYQSNESTPIADGSFITVAEGLAGLKFMPQQDTYGSIGFGFQVEAAPTNDGTKLSDPATVQISVTEVNDNPVLQNDTLDAVEENAVEQVISVDKLLENDKPGPTNEGGQTITITAVGNAVGGNVRLDESKTHVIFLPTSNFRGTGSFEYTVEDDGKTNGVVTAQSATATASFTISARADAPQVTPATTAEDTQTTTGLVITPTSNGGANTTHFRISGIQGGKLYQHDGLTPINDGAFITVAEGGAGLKFTPNPDAHGTSGFGFSVQAAPGTDGSLLSDAVPVSITVTEVNDDPKAEHDTLQQVAKGTPKVTIPFSDLLGNDITGPVDEQATQTLTVTDVSGAVGGTVSIVNGHVEFVPNPDFMGTASFTYTVSDGEKTDTSSVEFDIVDEDQPIITLNGDATIYLLKGQSYVEPGYSAYDDVDHDLTDRVVVTGSVDTSTLGTYELHYNVKDNSNNAAPQKTRTVHVVSSDLSALSVGTDGLTPEFQPDKQAYTLKVPSQVKDLNITATAADPTATVTINGVAKGHGGTQPVALHVGENDIMIVVTAQGGATTTYTLKVTRHSAPTNPGNGNGNGPKTRQAKVVTREMTDANTVQVDITRTTDANGKIVDSVALKGTKVDEVVAKAAADAADTVRIVIDDLPDQPADEVGVNVSSESLRKLKGVDLGLVIEASGARITLSADTLSQLSDGGKDLYFRVVPIRKQDESKQVKERVLDTLELQQYAHGNNVRAVGQPMTIETNYTNRKTKVMFPLTGIDIPTDPQERAAFLNGLAIFIEHTDGQKEVETGQLVYDEKGQPIGLEIGVEKFSTFTFISTDADFKTYLHYVSGYPDGTFQPEGNITRAEMASMIARQMELSDAAAEGRYSDLPAMHWASKAVLQLTAAGILSGDVNGSFRPEQGVTRAEMAMIAAKLKGLNLSGASNAFPDTQGHWAAAAIAAVQQAGLMSGYEDGTFRPNWTLTRAEAVVVLNRLFERPQLKDLPLATWPDVTVSDWASADIESASHDFRVYKDGSFTITDFKKPNQ